MESPPFRLWLVHMPDGDRLLLNANHAAFDGFGCVRFLQSVARAYTRQPDPGAPVSLTEARDVLRLLAAPDPAIRRRRLRIVAEKVGDLARRPTELAPDGGSDRPGYGIHHSKLSPEATAALDRDDDVTINDVLLAALHLTIEAWNNEHGARAGRIGTVVPVNVRPKDWLRDVVTNLVLDSRVVTSAAQRRSRRATLAAIAEQSRRVKEGGGAALIEAIGGWESMPLWTKQPLSSLLWLTGTESFARRCCPTSARCPSRPRSAGPMATHGRSISRRRRGFRARCPSAPSPTRGGSTCCTATAIPVSAWLAIAAFAQRFVDEVVKVSEA